MWITFSNFEDGTPLRVNKLINLYLTWSCFCLCCFKFRIVKRSKLASLTSFYLCWEVQSEKHLLACPQSLHLMGGCYLRKPVEASFISFMRQREGFYSLWHFGEGIARCLWRAAELSLQRDTLRWECRKNRQESFISPPLPACSVKAACSLEFVGYTVFSGCL